jgi:hypothetical protein
MVLVVLAAVGGGVLLLSGGGGAKPAANAEFVASPTPSPSAVESPTAAPTLPPSPSVSPSRSASPKPKPKPTPKPAASSVPAPPPPPAEPPGCQSHLEGTNAPKEQVGAALDAAAAKRFWTVSQVSLPVNLIKAIAEQESGWQSAIVSCIGAFGTMQVLPSTSDWMNMKFDPDYDLKSVAGNAMQGSKFLQWLIKYFADKYFDGLQGDYALRNEDCSQDPELADYKEWCLLNAVISAYNVGHGTVDKSATDDIAGYYINHAYIENVRALRSRF